MRPRFRCAPRVCPSQRPTATFPARWTIAVGGWIDTQVSGRQRRLDRALDVHVGSRRCLLHVEWQLVMTPDVPFRTYEYHVLLSLSEADR